MSAVVDTNVLIFDTFEDSELHRSATTKLDSLDKWHLTSIMFHELVWFFKGRGIQLARTRLKIEEYMTNEKTVFISCMPDDIRFAVTEIRNYRHYNDLVILSAAKRLGLPLFTFDDELKEIAVRYSVPLIT